MTKQNRVVRIGGASGFWGDSDLGPRQLTGSGKLDYLVFDYLAELTMSIMASARARSPDLGYATDFVGTLSSILRDVHAQGVRVISNAGGLNPRACAAAVQALADREGLPIRVAFVEGDDLMARTEEFRSAGVVDMGSGRPIPNALLSVNAYLGARPIADALGRGADIVITGRAVDSGLALGALVHAFGWSFEDFDRLSAGSLVGHLLECGAQATGGLHTDWEAVPDWETIGYPIAECAADGRFWMTKPEATGGLVNRAVICEQLLYEIGDPAAYALPDVICDWTQVKVTDVGADRVEVRGARGRPPSGLYKVSSTWTDGFRVTVQLTIVGIDAAAKAERTGTALLGRARAMLRDRNLSDFSETLVEVIGAEGSYGPHSRARDAREVQLRVSARHPDKAALTLLSREVAQAATSWSPGTTGVGRRAEASQVVRLFSFLWPADDVVVRVTSGDETQQVQGPSPPPGIASPVATAASAPAPAVMPYEGAARLIELAWARSGDKGDIANIGVVARSGEAFARIRRDLGPREVKARFSHLVEGAVERFELPGIAAFNFVLHRALGGGGMASLRIDPLGKGFAQMLLDAPLSYSDPHSTSPPHSPTSEERPS